MSLRDWDNPSLKKSLKSICSRFEFQYLKKDRSWWVVLKRGSSTQPIFRCADPDGKPIKPKYMHIYSAKMLRDFKQSPKKSADKYRRQEALKNYKERFAQREVLKDKLKDYMSYIKNKIDMPTVNLDRAGREEYLKLTNPKLYNAMIKARTQADPNKRNLVNI